MDELSVMNILDEIEQKTAIKAFWAAVTSSPKFNSTQKLILFRMAEKFEQRLKRAQEAPAITPAEIEAVNAACKLDDAAPQMLDALNATRAFLTSSTPDGMTLARLLEIVESAIKAAGE